MKKSKTDKIEDELIKSISHRVGELLKKQETGNFNNATPYCFNIGISGDVEEAFKEYKKESKELQKAYNIALKEINRLRKKLKYE